MASHLCLNCQKPMMLIRAIGRAGGLDDLHVLECKACHVCVTEAVAQPER